LVQRFTAALNAILDKKPLKNEEPRLGGVLPSKPTHFLWPPFLASPEIQGSRLIGQQC
jgi:hypothetical protein